MKFEYVVVGYPSSLTWRSSLAVLMEGLSSTSILINGSILLFISAYRLYKFLDLLYRYDPPISSLLFPYLHIHTKLKTVASADHAFAFYRSGGSLHNVWITAPDSMRVTLIGSVQMGLFVAFYLCGPVGKWIAVGAYISFVIFTNWLLNSQYSRVSACLVYVQFKA